MDLDSRVCVITIHLNLNSQGNEKFELFCQGAYVFENLGNETSFIANYDYVRKYVFG